MYNGSVFHHESKEDIENLGEYCRNTHSKYIELSRQRWTAISELVYEITSVENLEALKVLAELAYQVRRSTSFQNLLAFLHPNQQARIRKIVERIGKISKFYRAAVTIVRVAEKHCRSVSSICVKVIGFPKQSITLLSSRSSRHLESRLPESSRPRFQEQAGEASRLLKRWRGYVVHAEMQL